MRKTLIALASGGLANRLKTVLSALRIAVVTRRTLYVYWNPILHWNPDGTETRLPWPGGWNDMFRYRLNLVGWDFVKGRDWLPSATADDWTYHVLPREEPAADVVRAGWRMMRFEDEPDVDLLLSDRVTPRQRQVIDQILEFLPVVRPAPWLEEKVQRFAEQHGIGPETVGLHIRREHAYCRTIPWEAYFEAVDRLRAENPRVRIFLSSDSPETDRIMQARYSGLILYPKATHDPVRGLANGDALVDLCLLSRTGRIVGTCGSTFNEFAWWLGGCRVPNQHVLVPA